MRFIDISPRDHTISLYNNSFLPMISSMSKDESWNFFYCMRWGTDKEHSKVVIIASVEDESRKPRLRKLVSELMSDDIKNDFRLAFASGSSPVEQVKEKTDVAAAAFFVGQKKFVNLSPIMDLSDIETTLLIQRMVSMLASKSKTLSSTKLRLPSKQKRLSSEICFGRAVLRCIRSYSSKGGITLELLELIDDSDESIEFFGPSSDDSDILAYWSVDIAPQIRHLHDHGGCGPITIQCFSCSVGGKHYKHVIVAYIVEEEQKPKLRKKISEWIKDSRKDEIRLWFRMLR